MRLIFEILDVDNQTVTSFGWDESHRSPKKAYFSCVIGIYFLSFFSDHPVWIWHDICFYIPKPVEVDLIALFDQRLESRNQQRMFYFLTIIECYFFWICNNSRYKIWVKGSNNIEMLPWVNVSKVSFPWSLFGNKDTKLWRHHSQHFSSGKNNWASNNGPKSGVCMLLTGDLDLIISLQLIEGMCEGV